jgi:hypothetical protein
MPSVGFEATIPESARPQIYALDRAATGIGAINYITYWEPGSDPLGSKHVAASITKQEMLFSRTSYLTLTRKYAFDHSVTYGPLQSATTVGGIRTGLVTNISVSLDDLSTGRHLLGISFITRLMSIFMHSSGHIEYRK